MKKLGRPVTGRAKQHASIKLPARQIAWLKSTGNLSGTIEKIVEEKMSSYGTVNYQGQQYRLTEDASLSNRLFMAAGRMPSTARYTPLSIAPTASPLTGRT